MLQKVHNWQNAQIGSFYFYLLNIYLTIIPLFFNTNRL